VLLCYSCAKHAARTRTGIRPRHMDPRKTYRKRLVRPSSGVK
jgi:hypothetical protein